MSTAIAPVENLSAAELDQLCINTIRTLSIDAVQQANSGHPGTPMALAPLVYTIWNRLLNFDPQDPIWPNRDRFVLSNGHASMLLRSVLHLTGVQAVNADYETVGKPSVTLDDIRRFRQLDSKAPGHPEYHWVSGVETTTGPLGQGAATSVGLAIAEKCLAHRYNRPGFDIFNYHVHTVCGDGCLMEGIASEAASLAGHLGLDNLCWIYDNNHITIEGNTRIAFTEDVQTRFIAHGWNVLRVGDANDIGRIEQALEIFRKTNGRPTFIVLDSHIGYGSPHKQDTSAAHGEPLGEEEVRLSKRAYGFPEDAKFFVPEGVYDHFTAGIGKRGAEARQKWTELFESYRTQYPDLAVEVELMQKRELPTGWDRNLPVFPPDAKGIAGRDASGKALNVLAQNIPWFLGGSADLGPSNKTLFTYPGAGDFQADSPGGKNLHFGIRERRDGCDRQRTLFIEAASIWRDFLHIQRLRASCDSFGCPHGTAQYFCFHARCHGRRRGWPYASADRAPHIPACDTGAYHTAPGGCQRSSRGLPFYHAAAAQAYRAGVVASAFTNSRSQQICSGLRRRAGSIRARRRSRGKSGSDHHRFRQRA
jgi:transketolase